MTVETRPPEVCMGLPFWFQRFLGTPETPKARRVARRGPVRLGRELKEGRRVRGENAELIDRVDRQIGVNAVRIAGPFDDKREGKGVRVFDKPAGFKFDVNVNA